MRIHNFAFVTAIALAALQSASAQEPIKPPLNPRIITATRQVVIFTDLETQMLRAIQSKDQAGLSKLISEDCIIEMPDADPLTGEEWMKAISSMRSQGPRALFGLHERTTISLHRRTS